jgi:hypothetical protein
VYIVIGGVVAAIFAKRLPRDATPDLHDAKEEAQLTARDVAQGLRH